MFNLISPASLVLAGDGNVIWCSRCKTHFYSKDSYDRHPCNQ